MTERKTVTIASLKATVNGMLADSVPSATDGRVALAVLIERILMDAGAYHGFRYLSGVMDMTTDPPNMIGDETRRSYY